MPAIALWTPKGIGWTSVILGFPGALVLAALNWRRLGRPRLAAAHLAVAVLGAWALIFVNPGSIGLVASAVVGYYLYRTQTSVQSPLISAGRVTERNGLAGAMLALVGTIVVIGSGALIASAIGSGGIADRGSVMFGTGTATDGCAPAGRKSVFDPSDPIFLAAVMRETVRPGAHVVDQIDGPGVTVGPRPVTVEPPFECLVSTRSIGPLPPGTYVVRYRYEGQPELPDLASGSFTVVERPVPSGAPTPSP